MHTQSARSAIRKAIIEMEKPFCKADLLNRLEKQGFGNKGLILEIFNEMFDEGLIVYEAFPDGRWAFKVAS